LVGKFSHSDLGPIRFFKREPDFFTGSRIRGTQFLHASAFNGTIYIQQYVNSSFAISYIDFELAKSVELKWDFPAFNYFMLFVLDGKIAFDAGSGPSVTLSKGYYTCLSSAPQSLQLYEEEHAIILVVASNSNNQFEQLSLPDKSALILPFPAAMKLLLDEFLSNEYNELLLDLYYEKVVRDLLFFYFLSIQENSNTGRSAIPEPIKAAHDIIHHASRDRFYSLAELAELTGISESTLKKGYKKYYGTSPFDQQVLIRLKWAREQLENTDLPSSELFREAGYAYLTGFLKAFKKQYGLSPNEWRKRHKK
jgi:AraC-like DNA-binding protein